MSYFFLDHTSDIGVSVKAGNLQHAFEEACEALIELIFQNKIRFNLEQNQKEEWLIIGDDYESLLVNFLNEVLYSIDSKKVIPLGLKVIEIDSSHLLCSFYEGKFDLEDFPIVLYVKAVTFHQLSIEIKKALVEMQYFVDI